MIAPRRSRLSRAELSARLPFRLNTGRIRDQWHTMTRSGLSPRLSVHLPEPFVEVHPTDADAAGLSDDGFARVTTSYGDCVLKVSISEGQQRGSLFAPIHWSDQTASSARIGDLVGAATDPLSGQPELKATPARVEPLAFGYRGFALTRRPVAALPDGTWFARVAVAGGAGLLFASNEPPAAWRAFAGSILPADSELAEYLDAPRGVIRMAAFRAGRFDGCLFVGPAQAPPQWDVVRARFESGALAEHERRILLSGRSGDGTTETGPLICACFGVKLSAIHEVMAAGVVSVADIGRALRAGTNCGSCLPELRGIVERGVKPSIPLAIR